jgi:hypothetical protein
VNDDPMMRRPATFKEWKEMTGEDLEPEPTERDLAVGELLTPAVFDFPWPEQFQKDEFGNKWLHMVPGHFRGGVNPDLIPRPDLPPEENARRASRLTELASIAYGPTLAEVAAKSGKDSQGRKKKAHVTRAWQLYAKAVRKGKRTNRWGSVNKYREVLESDL